MIFSATFFIPTLILVAATVDDLRSKKVHNWLFLTCLAIALIYSFYLGGFKGLAEGLLGGLLALALTVPLFYFKILGGGDVKIFIAFGVAATMPAVLDVLLYSILWGALLGVLQAVFKKEGLALFKNSFQSLLKKPKDVTNLHKIPFTIALLCGWISHIILETYGRII